MGEGKHNTIDSLMSNRHAYLIMAHNEPELLKILVSLLDDKRNDIYIHLDKKSNIQDFVHIATKYASLTWTSRINVNWGGWSLVEAELLLLATARKVGGYAYYHLLSAVDLPLKKQDYIHEQLDSTPEMEYFDLDPREYGREELIRRTKWRFLFGEHYRDPCIFRRKFCSFVRNAFLKFQQILKIGKHYDVELAKGSNWFSVTESCSDYILSNTKWLKQNFRYAHAPDEIAISTLFRNSSFYKMMSQISIRKIDWKRGGPYTWQDEDYEELINSSALFARKFSSKNLELVYKIRDKVLNS